MIGIIIVGIVLFIGLIVCAIIANKASARAPLCSAIETGAYVVAISAISLAVLISIPLAIYVPFAIGAKYRADVVNKAYGTEYTAAEIFFASDLIETVRELDRSRIDLRIKNTQ